MRLVIQARRCGAYTGFEWPTSCVYWIYVKVPAHFDMLQYMFVHFHGCAFGLVSLAKRTVGQPRFKPWTVATDSVELARALDRRCTGHSVMMQLYGDPWYHIPCAGVNTRPTEGYTDDFAKTIHMAHRNIVSNHRPRLSSSGVGIKYNNGCVPMSLDRHDLAMYTPPVSEGYLSSGSVLHLAGCFYSARKHSYRF